MPPLRRQVTLLGVLVGLTSGACGTLPIPHRPEQLAFGPLRFEVPAAERYRHELPAGVVAYVVPDHSLPLVKVTLNFRTGQFRQADDRVGVAGLTAAMLRQGGTQRLTPEEFDQRADFLAANLASSAGATGATAALDVLSSALDEGLGLLFDMVERPRFDEARLAVLMGNYREDMKQRNDDAEDIEAREWGWLMYGPSHFASRKMTQADLERITRQDLVDFHRHTYGPEGMVIAVSGDVDTDTVLAKISLGLAGWRAGEKAAWPPTGPEFTARPGLYHIEKDIPQGKVAIGHRSLQWHDYGDPEMYALMVMDDVLGGAGFTARLTKRIRSDEGLAYGAYSDFGLGVFWPAAFSIELASKNETVALAAKIALEEIDRMRREKISAEELRISQASFIDAFPRSFESPARIAGLFANDEILGRPHSYWSEYRRRIQAVTAEEVQAVAEKYLRPEQLVMLVVGRWAEIAPGDPQGRARMDQLFGGQVTHLPLRDPLTLEPKP